MTASIQPLGVYVLGNDRVLDWCIAFLESFRTHNPELPLYLIPYNDQVNRLQALTTTYDFNIIDDPSLLELDALGQTFDDEGASGWVPMFRKFFAFWGPLEKAIYLDSDMVILDDLTELLTAFDTSNMDVAFFDETDEHIYESATLRRKLREQFQARTFNAGYWCARKGALSLHQVKNTAKAAQEDKHGFYRGMDQPFINYCVHTNNLSHTGLSDLIPDLAHHHWAAKWRDIQKKNGTYHIGHASSPDRGKRVKLLHWAGTSISPTMPYRKEFLKYRLKSASSIQHILYRVRAGIFFIIHNLPQLILKSISQRRRGAEKGAAAS